MKPLLWGMIIILCTQFSEAQNDCIIVLKDKTAIQCRIVENTPGLVTYKVLPEETLQKLSTGFIKEIRFPDCPGNPNIFNPSPIFDTVSYAISGSDGATFNLGAYKVLVTHYIWFGLDYSKVSLFFPLQTSKGVFREWNDYILTEPKFKTMTNGYGGNREPGDIFIPNMIIDKSSVDEINSKIDLDAASQGDSSTFLHLDTIRAMVKKYSSRYSTGIGVVFIVRQLRKSTETAITFLTFFDIKTRNVLLAIKMTNNAGGIGWNWHWTRPFFDIFEEINKPKTKKRWKSLYFKDLN